MYWTTGKVEMEKKKLISQEMLASRRRRLTPEVRAPRTVVNKVVKTIINPLNV
jgi:hypothetical protein